ncbi:MAG TPA: glycosyltransferase family 39 protein [Planctomycetota bacterium]|nr:glycosyltransferase family 39 protein [Planctomycetota bacterium]
MDLPLLAIVVVALGLRVQGINDDSFWLDEVTSLHDAARTVGGILAGKGRPGHPPLFYLVLKAWIAAFGVSEVAVRTLSALCGTAAVALAYALFRALHGRAAGLAAALLLALSFHHIVFSQEARNYALFGALALASAWALWRALSEGGRGRWTAYVVVALLLVYTHHQAYVVLAGLAAGAALACPRKGALKGLALADAIVLAAAVPSLILYLRGGSGYGFWQPRVSWQGLAECAAVWTPGASLVPDARVFTPNRPVVPWHAWLPLTLLLPAGALALSWARPRASDAPSPRPPPVLFHLGALYGGVGIFLLIALAKPIWHVRYVFVYLPLFLGGLAAVLVAFRGKAARITIVALAIALLVPGTVAEKRRFGRTPWREAARVVRESVPPGSPVYLIGPPFLASPFRWYYKGPASVVTNKDDLVHAVTLVAEAGGPVVVVYCDAHSPPDPRKQGVRDLAGLLELRAVTDIGPLHVYVFRKRR